MAMLQAVQLRGETKWSSELTTAIYMFCRYHLSNQSRYIMRTRRASLQFQFHRFLHHCRHPRSKLSARSHRSQTLQAHPRPVSEHLPPRQKRPRNKPPFPRYRKMPFISLRRRLTGMCAFPPLWTQKTSCYAALVDPYRAWPFHRTSKTTGLTSPVV